MQTLRAAGFQNLAHHIMGQKNSSILYLPIIWVAVRRLKENEDMMVCCPGILAIFLYLRQSRVTLNQFVMKNKKYIVAVLALLLAAPACNAQLLKGVGKKIGQGLDKVAEKIVDGAVDTAKGVFTDPNNPNNKGGVPDNLESSYVEGRKIEEEKVVDNSTRLPFRLPSPARQVPCETPGVIATSMSEGIFAVNHNGVYTFYTFDGISVTHDKWVSGNSAREPLMSPHGVIMAKVGEEYGKPLYLIDRYGGTKQLPAGITSATNFVDGLAIATVNGKQQFIDKNCKVVFPDIHPLPGRIDSMNYTVARLKDHRRAFLDQQTYKWGFMDKNGKVVIAPQFQEVRSFREGLALVKDANGKVYFINQDGKKAFDPKWKEGIYMNSISDFDSGICAVNVGWENDDNYTYYYDALGDCLGAARRGSAFYKGKAYCCEANSAAETDPKEPPYKIHQLSTGIKPLGEIDKGDYFIPEVNSEKPLPYYDAKGVAHISDRNTIGELGNPEYFYDYSLGKYSHCGYAHFEMQMPDGTTYYKGFVDTSGTIAIIYSVQKTESFSLD